MPKARGEPSASAQSVANLFGCAFAALVEHARRDLHTVPSCGESSIRSCVQDDLENFLFCGSIPERHPNIQFESARSSQRSQHSNRTQAAGLQIQSGPGPNLSCNKPEDETFQVWRKLPPALPDLFRFRLADHAFQHG